MACLNLSDCVSPCVPVLLDHLLLDHVSQPLFLSKFPLEAHHPLLLLLFVFYHFNSQCPDGLLCVKDKYFLRLYEDGKQSHTHPCGSFRQRNVSCPMACTGHTFVSRTLRPVLSSLPTRPLSGFTLQQAMNLPSTQLIY